MMKSIRKPITILLNRITLAMMCCCSAFASISAVADGFRWQDAKVDKIDKTKWQCQYCQNQGAASSVPTKEITVSLTNNSDDNGRFSTITGDQRDGVGAALAADIGAIVQDKHYRLQVEGLGKDNAQISLLTTKTHDYKVEFNYHRLNQFGYEQTVTPFENPGGRSLRLPSDWQRVPATADMPSNSFNLYANQLERQYWQLGAEKQFTDSWQGYVSYQHENKQGKATVSGNILTNAVLLPTGIEQRHQQLDLGSYLAVENATLLINFYQSDFNNQRSAVTWQSPFALLHGGSDRGQLATEPDNKFNQLSAIGSYRFSDITLQARVVYGQMTQDQSFLAYSTNSELNTLSLPATNLDGEINTFSAQLKALYQASKNWRLLMNYMVDDRDNNTQSLSFQQVLSDSVLLDTSKANRPYSFTREQLKFESQWRVAPRSQLVFGAQLDQRERDWQDRHSTQDKKFWLKLITQVEPFNSLSFQWSRQLRDGSRYQRAELLSPVAESLEMQRFYMADREHEEAKGRVSFNPIDDTEVSVQAYFTRDSYHQTDIGLSQSKRHGIDLSASRQLTASVSVSAYVHNQWQDSRSQGSYWFSQLDWLMLNDDKADTAGLSLVAVKLADGKLTLAADYHYSYARGLVAVNQISQGLSDQHQELTVNGQEVKLSADYSYSDDTRLHTNLLIQHFEEDDWRAQYSVDRIINVLGNGLVNYDYDAYRLEVGVTYQF